MTQAPAGKQRIMDVAAGLFIERGVNGASLRQIADLVGMKAGSLYYHFGSKNELLSAIFKRGIEVMVTAFDEADTATSHLSGRERVGAHVRAHLAALFENGPYTAAHVTAFRTAPAEVRDAIVPVRDDYEAMWTNLLRELVSSGALVSSAPLGLHRLLLFGAMNASVEWFDPSRGNLDDLANAITNQFWDGLAQEASA
ncbi:MAG: TetR/AcrR family transcriptional regulator [Acidimicrobiaceae bacterium]|nr:TetR/AcrR family transcriptional regulator [Acidimicrobiaceae bacterium]